MFYLDKVELLSENVSNLNNSDESDNREVCTNTLHSLISYSHEQKYFKLCNYLPINTTDIAKQLLLSQESNSHVKSAHSLMIFKDIEFFAQHVMLHFSWCDVETVCNYPPPKIDDLYVVGTDLFNIIAIVKSFEEQQKDEMQEVSILFIKL